MNLKTNLRGYEVAVREILRQGVSAEKKLELAELHVHINDGNYNQNMLERAIKLSKEFRDEATRYEEKLQELKAKGLEETGSRARREILEQFMSSIKEALNEQGREALPDYYKAVDKLEKAMKESNFRPGERQYDEDIKPVWVNIREEMYAETGERKNLSERTQEAKANMGPSVSVRQVPTPSRERY